MRSSSEWKLITTSRPPGREQRRARPQRLFELLKLGVDENPKSLKCARCRVLARLAGLDRASHERRPARRWFEQGARSVAPSNNRLCNLNSKPFFPIVTYHLRNVALVGAGQEFRRALAARGVHAHVQRAVEAEARSRAPGSSICGEVTPRSSSTPLTCAMPRAASSPPCAAKRGVLDREARIVGESRRRRRAGDRRRVLVEGDQAALRRQPLEERARVAAAAEGAVDVDAVGSVTRASTASFSRTVGVLQGGVRRVRQKVKFLSESGIGDCITSASCAAWRSRVPELEVAAHAEQHHVALEAGRGAQLGGDQDARRGVDVDVHRVAEEDALPAARIHRQARRPGRGIAPTPDAERSAASLRGAW